MIVNVDVKVTTRPMDVSMTAVCLRCLGPLYSVEVTDSASGAHLFVKTVCYNCGHDR